MPTTTLARFRSLDAVFPKNANCTLNTGVNSTYSFAVEGGTHVRLLHIIIPYVG
jgi:hypothetical protein